MKEDIEKRFQTNVMLWAKSYPKQAFMLPYINSSHLIPCVTKQGEPNLKIEFSGKKIPLHTQNGAAEEAKEWFRELHLKNDIPFVCIYGVGLGYYYDAISPWLKKNRERRAVFLEDDLAVVQKLLETERGTRILNDPQVKLVAYADLKGDEQVFEGLYWNFALTRLAVTSLESYSLNKSGQLKELRHKISFDAAMKNALVDEYMRYGANYYINFYRNMLCLDESYLGNSFFGKFKGVPAIICGAGPSLAKHLPLLKEHLDKAVVFAGGSALNVLNSAGFQPHFGAGIDPNPAQFTRMSLNQAYEVPFFYRNRMYHDAFRLIHGPRLYITGAGGYDTAEYFEKELKIAGEELDEGHNVVNFCVEIAQAMGCNPLIFVGMDLAYTGMKEYAPGVVEDATVSQTAILDVTDQDAKAIVRDDLYGKPTFTLWKWVAESEWIGNYPKEHPGLRMINCTEGGLGFPGIPNRPFKEVVKEELIRVRELKNRVHGETQNSTMPKFTRKKIVSLMNKLSESLDRTMKELKVLEADGARATREIEKGAKEYKQSGQAALAETELADEDGYKHVLAVFNEVYSHLLSGELHEIQTKKQTLQKKLIKRLDLSKRKFAFLSDVALANRELIKYAFEKCREDKSGIKAEVPTEPFKPGKYLFTEGQLTIEDEEIGIGIDVPFTPKLVPKKGKNETDLGGGWHSRNIRDNEGNLLECYVEKNGLQDGQALEYYPDGSVKSESFYTKGKLHGPSSFWSKDGVLLAESWYFNGIQQGKSLWYYPTGELYALQQFLDGEWHGRQEYYYAGGALKSLLTYKKGKIVGTPLLLCADGTLYRNEITGER